MKNKISIRSLIYVIMMLLFVAAVQLKMQKILNDRNLPVVSLPSEVQKYGWAVDLEKIVLQDLLETSPLTLRVPDSNKMGQAHPPFFLVSSSQKNKIKNGQALVDTNWNFLGSVASVAPSASLSHGLFRVFVNLKRDVQFSQLMKTYIVLGKRPQQISVLSETVDLKNGKAYVWVSENNQAKRVQVQLGPLYNERYQIQSGLREGQLVIVEGQKSLKEGAKLRVRNCKQCKESEVES